MKKNSIGIIGAFGSSVLNKHQKALVSEIARLEQLQVRLSVAANKNVDSLVAEIKEQAKSVYIPNSVFIEKELEFETQLALKGETPTQEYCNVTCINDYYFLFEKGNSIFENAININQITELRINRTR